jgi:isopentenyldiphosphate isomerase/intracellular septation protein A
LLKKLIPGLIPLLAYILADELWGMKVGLVVAVSIAVIELLVTYLREKRLDRFVLLDILLLFALSSLSYLFENDIFFKVKPAMIDMVMVFILSLSLFTRIDPLGAMSQRYLKGVALNGHQKNLFRKNMWMMLWLLLVHIVLVIWAAFFMSKEVWAFVSTFLLFIMMGGYFGLALILQKFKKNRKPDYSDHEEWLPMVDEEGRILGKALRSYCHNGSRTLHPVVHLHLLGPDHSIFLQKRAITKLVQPGKWDTAVGGHLSYGETIEDSLKREAAEEIGLTGFEAIPALQYRWDSPIESELVYCFITRQGTPAVLSPEEISEGKFWKFKAIDQNLGKGIFTPNFEHEYQLLKKTGILK